MPISEEIFSIAEEIVGEYTDALMTGREVINTDRKRPFTEIELIDEIQEGLSIMQTYYAQKEVG